MKKIVFDLGGVLIDYNPFYLYRQYFDSDNITYNFINTVFSSQWNEEQELKEDTGIGINTLIKEYPHYSDLIKKYENKWGDMIKPNQEIYDQILNLNNNFELYILSNITSDRFPFVEKIIPDVVKLFKQIYLSGNIGLRKPDIKLYQIVEEQIANEDDEIIFFDDNYENICAAKCLGWNAIQYTWGMKIIEYIYL